MPKAPVHHLMVEEREGVLVVSFLATRLQGSREIDEISQLLNQEVEASKHDRIVLDLGRVEFAIDYFLGKLIQLNRKLILGHRRLKLCCLHPHILELFRITQLHRYFEIHDDQQSAIEGF